LGGEEIKVLPGNLSAEIKTAGYPLIISTVFRFADSLFMSLLPPYLLRYNLGRFFLSYLPILNRRRMSRTDSGWWHRHFQTGRTISTSAASRKPVFAFVSINHGLAVQKQVGPGLTTGRSTVIPCFPKSLARLGPFIGWSPWSRCKERWVRLRLLRRELQERRIWSSSLNPYTLLLPIINLYITGFNHLSKT